MKHLHALLHESRHRLSWRALLAVLMVISGWFAFTPQPAPLQFENADKVHHLLAFGAMAVAAALSGPAGLRMALIAGAGLLAYGGLIEVVQTYIPNRQGDWADLAADACGIALGLLCAGTLRSLSRRWLTP